MPGPSTSTSPAASSSAHWLPASFSRGRPSPSSWRRSGGRAMRSRTSRSDTRRRYLEVWSAHLLPRLGEYELRADHADGRRGLPRTDDAERRSGAPTQRKALMLLQGILKRAVVRGTDACEPGAAGRQAQAAPTQLPQPLAPETVERIRAKCSSRGPGPSRRRGLASARAANTRRRSDRRGIVSETR